MPLILHRGGPLDGKVESWPLSDDQLDGFLSYGGNFPKNVKYQRTEPLEQAETARGVAEVWELVQ